MFRLVLLVLVSSVLAVHAETECVDEDGNPSSGSLSESLSILSSLLSGGVNHPNSALKNRWFNDSCNATADCANPEETISAMGAKACINGRCGCKPGYNASVTKSDGLGGASGASKWSCDSPPGSGDSCTAECKKPFTCALGRDQTSGSSNTNSALASLMGMTSSASSSRSDKHCRCQKPYVKRGTDCYIDCAADEIYVDFQCKKRCGADEIFLDGKCVKLGAIGEPCQDKRQCTAPFSDCKSGSCQCIEGTAENKKANICEAKTYNCPFGDALKDSAGGGVRKCRANAQLIKDVRKLQSLNASIFGISAKEQEQECPDGHFCMLTGFGDSIVLESADGHCCPKPKPSCPVGVPHPTGQCPDELTQASAVSNDSSLVCPNMTHYCHRSMFFWRVSVLVCCPQACAADQVYANGKCLPIRKFADKCDANEQCGDYPTDGMICGKGQCTCADGYVGSNTTDYPDSKMLFKCKPRSLDVGDGCDPDGPDRCPLFSRCSRTTKKCACKCGYYPAAGRCSDKTISCPSVAGVSATTTESSSSDSQAVNVSDYTFCKLPGVEGGAASLVDACPANHFCSAYLDDAGVCCPKPSKAFCPDGSEAKVKCSPSVPNACGRGMTCWNYLKGLPSDVNAEGNVCCPSSV